MITDKETYEVFLSTWLKKSHSTFFDKFTTCLNENNIKWRFIGNTADIWCRDYMPIQIEVDEFVQYHYYPDYLTQRESYKNTLPNQKSVQVDISFSLQEDKLSYRWRQCGKGRRFRHHDRKSIP